MFRGFTKTWCYTKGERFLNTISLLLSVYLFIKVVVNVTPSMLQPSYGSQDTSVYFPHVLSQ